ncbi:response regulator receiver domain [Vibrio splendidus]|uniref:response regulator receiver domain n=1 Tax=Vibrio splendidus TaxID=29497 RepID=UPI00352C3833
MNSSAVAAAVEVPIESAPKYHQMIHEAFIDPIKNVTVIDDEYPTLSQFLVQSTDAIPHKQLKPENIERLKSIISMCHQEKNWSLDVFDGKDPKLGGEDGVPPYLNHSDLVVLDYHLEGVPTTNSGERARKIISELKKNNRFNIILVHTKGFDGGDIEKVFDEVLGETFIFPEKHPFVIDEESEDAIDAWLDDNDDGSSYSFFSQRMGIKSILDHLSFGEKNCGNVMFPQHFLNSFKQEVIDVAKLMGIPPATLTKWYVGQQLKMLKIPLVSGAVEDTVWCWKGADNPNFISTGRVFISVIRKGDQSPETELIDPLKAALVEANSSPMHLLMAKIRASIDENGLEQANKIVSQKEAQAGWLNNLLKEGALHTHNEIISAHWEQLARATHLELKEFSQRLVDSVSELVGGGAKDAEKYFFGKNLDPNNTLAHLNAFNCSQPEFGPHLTTGTVLRFDGDLWVCLSPSCDLVPRERKSWESRIGSDFLAFKAVKLLPVTKLSRANEDANSNNFIYLVLDGEPKAFCLGHKPSDNPVWDVFYAFNQGVFSTEGDLRIFCLRQPARDDESDEEKQEAKDKILLETQELLATPVSELRYEYALNLLQKFGSNQTRVGLGFTDSTGFMQ